MRWRLSFIIKSREKVQPVQCSLLTGPDVRSNGVSDANGGAAAFNRLSIPGQEIDR